MSRKSRAKRWMRIDAWRLRVMAEYGSSGIWGIGPIGPFRHGMIEHSSLRLPPDLSRRFEIWIEQYEARLEYPEFQQPGFDSGEFNRIGRALAQDLKAHVGPAGYVEFLPELESGGLGAAEILE